MESLNSCAEQGEECTDLNSRSHKDNIKTLLFSCRRRGIWNCG